MQPGSSKCKLAPFTGKVAQLLPTLFKNPMTLERQLESAPLCEVPLFLSSTVSWLIITSFIPLTEHLRGAVSQMPHPWGKVTQTQLKQHKKRCGNGSWAQECMCMYFHIELEATTKPGRKTALF